MQADKVQGGALTQLLQAAGRKKESTGAEPFAKSIGEVLKTTNEELVRSETAARELAAGRGDLVDTMIAMGRADLSLRFVVNMRNRVIESYNEIMRLQV